MSLQRQRINDLQIQLQKKETEVAALKAQKWAKAPSRAPNEKFRLLKSQIKQKNWVQALKISNQLKKKYPNSVVVAKYRYSIFKKLGLQKQAVGEMRRIQKLKAKRSTKKRVI